MEGFKRFNASRGALYIFLGVIGAFMLLLNLLTPYCADDFAYMESFDTQQWIERIWDVFPSMAAHARTMNGRLISHGLGQLFMIWMPAEREQRIAEAKAEGQREVSAELIRPSTKYSAYWGVTDLTEDPDAWPNNYISTYYGIRISGR